VITGIDLVIVDIPNNLDVPNISIADGEVPTWNMEKAGFLDTVFYFSSTHLQNDGAISLFYVDNSKLKMSLRGFLKVYHFKVHKEGMGINRLRMTSAREVGRW
jgi:hypothetical protein